MAIKACCGAHHLGRILRDQGHQIRLMSREYIRPYLKSHKNNDWDAEANAEAASDRRCGFLSRESLEQLNMQSLHGARARLIGNGRHLMNHLRAVLIEQGITIAQGRRKLEEHLPRWWKATKCD